MKKRLVSAFLALSLVSAMFPPGALAAKKVSNSPGTDSANTATAPTAPVQTPAPEQQPVQTPEQQPVPVQPAPVLEQVNGVYQIKDAAGLLAFARLVNGADGPANANAALAADITLTAGAWTPIGSTAKPYTGTFQGAGHVISGLKGYLFDTLGVNGKIENVLLSGVEGYICQVQYGTITNCTNNIPAPGTTGGNTAAPGTTGGNTAAPGTTGGNTAAPGTTGGSAAGVQKPAVTVTPANASCRLGETVSVQVRNAAPDSYVLLKGKINKKVDTNANGEASFTIEAKAETFTPGSGKTETFDFTLESGGAQVGSFHLTVTDPNAAGNPVKKSPSSAAPSNQGSGSAGVQTNSNAAPPAKQDAADSTAGGGSVSPRADDDKINLSTATITLRESPNVRDGKFIYDGKNRPDIIVTCGGNPLMSTDYTISYEGNSGVTSQAIIGITAAAGSAYTGVKTRTFEIIPRELTINSVEAESRDYKANDDTVRITKVTLDGVCAGETVTVNTTNLWGLLSSGDAATYQSITGFSGTVSLDANAASGNYTLTQPNGAVTVTGGVQIRPVEVQIADVKVEERAYNGLTDASVEVAFNPDLSSEDYEVVDARFADANAGNNKAVTGTVRLKNQNCTFANGQTTTSLPNAAGTILKADLELDRLTKAVEKEYDGTPDIALKPEELVLKPATLKAVDVIDSVKAAFKDAEVGENKEFTVQATLKAGLAANFNISGGTIEKTFTGGSVKAVAPSNITWPTVDGVQLPGQIELTYGQTLNSLTLTGGSTDGKFVWTDGDQVRDASSMPYDCELTFVPTITSYRPIPVTVPVMVKKATILPEIPEANKTLQYGQQLAEITKDVVVTNPAGKVDDKEMIVPGNWNWEGNNNHAVPDQSGAVFQVQFTPDLKNYELPDKIPVTVTVAPSEPVITFTPENGKLCTPGESITVMATLKNQYNQDENLVHKPAVGSITYEIDGEAPVTIANGESFQISTDIRNGRRIKITVTSAADSYYTAKTEVHTLTVTDKDLVTVTAKGKGKVYDGIPCEGYEDLKFQDEKGTNVSPEHECVWRTSNGTELSAAPVDAGSYTVQIFAVDGQYAGSSEEYPFTISKRQLQWPASGWLSAHKEVGSSEEADVTGTIELQNLLPDDRETVKLVVPAMRTQGFAQHTTQGKYTDVEAVPKTGSWADAFVPAVLKNYEWPTGNPKVEATVGDKTASTEPPKVPPEAEALKQPGQSLQMRLEKGISAESLAILKNNGLSSAGNIEKVLKGAVQQKNNTIREENLVVYDLTMMVRESGGEWQPATKANFPSDGKLTVTLPYPGRSNKDTRYFTIAHMYTMEGFGQKIGYVEYPTVSSRTDSSISFVVTGLSPIAIGWSDSQPTTSGDKDKDPDKDKDKDDNTSSKEDTYRIRVLDSKNGRVSVSHSRAEEDETVTITVRPRSGYELDELTVTDSRDREIRIRERSNNRYTFKMPARTVTVDATFTNGSTGNLTQTTLPSWTNTNNSYLACDGLTSCPSRRYPDLNPAMWYHIPIDFNIQRGLMGAMGDGRFGPNETLTRAMLVQILYSHAGRPSAPANPAFRDVDRGAWYENAVSWAASQGIASGTGNGLFAPNAPITREQLAVMLYNYASRRGLSSVAASRPVVSFSDSARISYWAASAVSAMQQAGVVTGKANNSFDPKGRASRAETAQMLWNLLK